MSARCFRSPSTPSPARLSLQVRAAHRTWSAAWLAVCMTLSCAPPDHDKPTPPQPPVDTFADHTVKRVADVATFDALAADGASSTALKFIITRFLRDDENVRFLDSTFYQLHDEWWWFRLMNGAAIDGIGVVPADVGRSFDTVSDIVTWARAQPAEALPLDLAFVQDGSRLYSPLFYSLALTQSPKVLGVGTVLRFPARPEVDLDETWAIEVEFSHVINKAELTHMLSTLEDALPAGVGPQLKFLVRSAQHEAFAQALVDDGDPLADRIIRYRDVTVPGEIEVYSEGLTAGRLRFVRRGQEVLSSLSTDILVVEDTPDFLPQCAGLITSVPQTALAHVNILAKNRGIPNAYQSGILEDPELDQLARVRAPVIVRARGDHELDIVPLSESDFTRYRQLTQIPDTNPDPIDISNAQHAYLLNALNFADEATLRPILGGKSMGYVALLNAGDVTTPPDPVGISIVPYLHHTAELRQTLPAVLGDAAMSDANVRYLLLEGTDAFVAAHPQLAGFPETFLATRGDDDRMKAIILAGGIQRMIEDKPIATADMQLIVQTLEQAFGDYADDQPLRFRSSSNIEDAEGFNGAGLYTSNSGYLHAERLSGGKKDDTVDNAIRATWASYWGFEAFEERRLARASHLGGSMGITVHAGFPDAIERSNGVFTLTLLPSGHPDGDAVLIVNVQKGALSVTNPPPGDPNLPEVDHVTKRGDELTITRVRPSTLSVDEPVLSDTQLFDIFVQAERTTRLWRDTQNQALPQAQRRSTLTLDFELRHVAAGWPKLNGTNQYGSRVIIKQARTLEPSLVRIPSTVLALPAPRDVLARARRVEQRTCVGDDITVSTTDIYTDEQKRPDMGFSLAPLTVFTSIEWHVDAPAFAAVAGTRRGIQHLGFVQSHPGMAEGGPYAADFTITPNNVAAFHVTHMSLGDSIVVENDSDSITNPATCTTEILHASPEDFLAALLEAAE